MGNPNWKKGGPSPNAKGRPKAALALSELARQKVDKEELIDIFYSIAKGEPLVRTLDTATGRPMPADKAPEGAQVTEVIWPSNAERLRAAEFIWDKIEPPVKKSEVTVKTGDQAEERDYKQLSDQELDDLLALHEKARVRELPEGVEEEKVIDVPTTDTSGNKDKG